MGAEVGEHGSRGVGALLWHKLRQSSQKLRDLLGRRPRGLGVPGWTSGWQSVSGRFDLNVKLQATRVPYCPQSSGKPVMTGSSWMLSLSFHHHPTRLPTPTAWELALSASAPGAATATNAESSPLPEGLAGLKPAHPPTGS